MKKQRLIAVGVALMVLSSSGFFPVTGIGNPFGSACFAQDSEEPGGEGGAEPPAPSEPDEIDPAKLDLNKLKGKLKKGDLDKAMNILNQKTGGDSGVDGGSSGTVGDNGTPLSVSDMVSQDSGPLNDSDKAYVKAHWTNARRNYKKKNFDRVMEEVKNILSVDKNHGESFLMKASVHAMRKEFLDAWKSLERARKTLGTDPKLTKFEETLQKASPKPDAVSADDGSGSRTPATHASEAAMDALVDLFADREATAKVSGFSIGDVKEADGKVLFPITISGVAALDASAIEKKLKLGANVEIKDVKPVNEGKSLDLIMAVSLPLKNPGIKAVRELPDYLKEISEELDVKIDRTEEGTPDAEKCIDGTYTLMGRSMTDVNTMLRRLSPHTVHYSMQKIAVTSVGNSVVWKGSAKIRFKTE